MKQGELTVRHSAIAVGQLAAIAMLGVLLFRSADEWLFLLTVVAAPVALLVVIYRAAPGGSVWAALPVVACGAIAATAVWVAATDRLLNEIRESDPLPPSIASQAANAVPWCAVAVGVFWVLSSLAKWDRGWREDGEHDEGK